MDDIHDLALAAVVVAVGVFLWWDWRRDRERWFADTVETWQSEYLGGPLGGPQERVPW